MKLSLQSICALRFLSYLAKYHQDDGFHSLRDICIELDLSFKYLEKVVSVLVKHNIVISSRGVMGGYRLIYDPTLYNVGDIIILFENKDRTIKCSFKVICKQLDCHLCTLSRALDDTIIKFLNTYTIQDLLKPGNGFI